MFGFSVEKELRSLDQIGNNMLTLILTSANIKSKWRKNVRISIEKCNER